jgi:hypothetical protein
MAPQQPLTLGHRASGSLLRPHPTSRNDPNCQNTIAGNVARALFGLAQERLSYETVRRAHVSILGAGWAAIIFG